MAKIEPFKSIHYNLENVGDISKVVCPPYDIISPVAQEDYYQRHSYNIIRLILGKDFSADKEGEDKYNRAAGYLEDWLRRAVLVKDLEPAIYFYEQIFTIECSKKTRLGFIALLRLDGEGENKTIHPHEHTHTAPKEDRLKLIKSVEANLSPIFTVFSDPKKNIAELFKKNVKNTVPFFDIIDDTNIENRIWCVTDKDVIDKIKTFFADKELFIADGHHRYEVAKTFRDYKRSSDSLNFKDSYNYIMSYFTILEGDGLCILPTHRLIKNTNFSSESFSQYFTVKEFFSKEEFCSAMKQKEDEVGVFGAYRDKKFYLLKLSDKRACNKFIQDGPKEYKDLDVVILHKVIFDQVLTVTLPQISYEVSLDRAVTLVDEKIYDAVFILNPTKIEQIRSIALGGEVMPQKSTYFYPKLLSGLLIHKF